MKMGMEVEFLSPGMQHGGDSEIAVEALPTLLRTDQRPVNASRKNARR
jgi:hypothetical protein